MVCKKWMLLILLLTSQKSNTMDVSWDHDAAWLPGVMWFLIAIQTSIGTYVFHQCYKGALRPYLCPTRHDLTDKLFDAVDAFDVPDFS